MSGQELVNCQDLPLEWDWGSRTVKIYPSNGTGARERRGRPSRTRARSPFNATFQENPRAKRHQGHPPETPGANRGEMVPALGL